MKRKELLAQLKSGQLLDRLAPVYGEDAPDAAQRLLELTLEYADIFPCEDSADTWLFSAPGRTELGGNHTDHQHGHCIAASVDLDTIACVVPNDSGVIRIQSRHHKMAEIDLSDLSLHPEETGSSVSLIRGVAARLTEMGHTIGGFDAYTTTRVLRGSGLSSSAAFEVLICTVMNTLFCDNALTATQIAQVAQYAENIYYGKPCGLLDQLACATGGVIAIDFADPADPVIRQVQVDLARHGHALCIIDSHASHADLTDAFAAIPHEMGQVASFFGQQVLRDVPRAELLASLAGVRAACGDRAVLRALHFYHDSDRALQQCAALEQDDFQRFLELVRRSGQSSWTCLQNVSTCQNSGIQPIALILALAEELLAGRGACRVHGGGFAGTVQVYVPLDMLDHFVQRMEAMMGDGSCHIVTFRSAGSAHLLS